MKPRPLSYATATSLALYMCANIQTVYWHTAVAPYVAPRATDTLGHGVAVSFLFVVRQFCLVFLTAVSENTWNSSGLGGILPFTGENVVLLNVRLGLALQSLIV